MSLTYPYQYSDLRDAINTRIHNKIGLIANVRTAINNSVNEANVQFRSAKRKAVLAPNLFNDIYQYAAPSDIDGENLIGIQPQSMDRTRDNIWERVTEEEFDIRKQTSNNLVSFGENSGLKTLLISMRTNALNQLTIANLQALTGDASAGASWAAFGDATNLRNDTFNFIKGSGSVEFDLLSGGTTAGLVLTTVNVFDLTLYKTAASVFTWVYINSITGVTNFKLRVGNSASAYYEMTATTPNDGTSFVNGWNLVRFDFNSKTTTGSVTDTTCNYVALFMTKTAGKAVDSGYRFNWLNAKQGQISNLVYYSQYPWIGVDGTYKVKSTIDTDYLIADSDEFPIILEKCVQRLGQAAREYQDSKDAAQSFTDLFADYKRKNPTETLQTTSSYHFF